MPTLSSYPSEANVIDADVFPTISGYPGSPLNKKVTAAQIKSYIGTGSGAIIASQDLDADDASATFDLTSYGFGSAPQNILPQIVRANGSSYNLSAFSRAWTATSFTCDFSSPTPDDTYVCIIQITP